jgi:hypothetical protein
MHKLSFSLLSIVLVLFTTTDAATGSMAVSANYKYITSLSIWIDTSFFGGTNTTAWNDQNYTVTFPQQIATNGNIKTIIML